MKILKVDHVGNEALFVIEGMKGTMAVIIEGKTLQEVKDEVKARFKPQISTDTIFNQVKTLEGTDI